MSVSQIQIIMNRIASATPESPLAVWRHTATKANGSLDCCFASTVQSVRHLRDGSRDLVGIYDNTMPADVVRSQLNDAVRR
jgi:hypothetical protein